MALEKLDIHMRKNKVGPLHYILYKNIYIKKINSKCIKNRPIRHKTIKLLENIGGKLHHTGFGN